MDTSLILVIILQVVLIALNAIFASAEIAVLSINETKLEKMSEEGNKKAKRLFKLTREPAKFLATIQVAITLSGFLGSAFAADNFSEPLVDWVISLGVPLSRGALDSIAVIVITLILSYFTLVFGELVPKRLAMKKSEKIAMGISGLVSAISVIFKPVVWFLSVSTNLVLKMCGVDPREAETDLSEEEILMMVDAGSEKGAIEHEEKELIQNVFDFNDITVDKIITHRTDADILLLEDSDEEWEETIYRCRHTRYPVCEGTADNIIGILNAKDYFPLADKSRENVLSKAVHEAYFIPKKIKADTLFRNMKETGNPMAVVVDEYGGMEGIVTVLDLVEELVGKFHDESESIEESVRSIEKIGEDTWKINENVTLSDLEDEIGTSIDGNDDGAEFDTFTGLCFHLLGYIPEDGDEEIEVELEDAIAKITKIEAHQIEEAILTLVKKEDCEASENDD